MSELLRPGWPRTVRTLLVLGLVVAGIVACETPTERARELSPPSLAGTATTHDEGRQLFLDYGCASCHQLSGVRQATGRVGPALDGLAEQRIIAGVLPNTPEHLAAWIVSPRDYAPTTGMPDVGVSPDEARAIADFLLDQTG